ncbi:TonB-dependent receptor [Pseudoduganella sp. FT25W]|uniref:TonB-dependent receptor n=1 Tax=Duganella alba TaxID=2666081 RepID=A0A6L5QF04_9BURK|nr:TonB-dependent receptor [Duganella alba]MRX08306.1 TonB-dependent receptor [Duganella alba]MRX16845.1 TonB-dependent receptor [Duganella alba]
MTKETVISRSLRLMFSGTVAFGAIAGAHAQTAPDAPMARVEITGSSIKRAQVEGALPVQTVTREDIAKTGATSTEALLASISANTAVGGTVSAQGAGASTYGLAAASLRGLGSNKTLVLVNGRRLANFATDGTSVDINSIPLAAVDHVEILKDGASGVYGSDAIGGVINFILRNNYNGVEVTGYGSGTKDGGGRNTKASIIAGFGDFDEDRYNFTVSADVAKEQAIYGSQRGYARESWNNNGLRDASATPSGALSTFNPVTKPNAAGIIPNALATLGSGLGNPLNGGDCTANGSQFDANTGSCRYNSAGAVPLFPDVTRANVSANFRFKLNEQNEFFVEGFHSEQKTTTTEQSSPYSASFLSTDNAFATANVYPAIILSPSSPYYPSSYLAANYPSVNGQPVTVSYRAFDGGGRSHDDHAKMSHLVMGFRGTVKGYDYDVAYTHNSSNVSEDTIAGYQSQLALTKLLSNNNAFNPWAATQSPALAQQIYATNYVGNMINSTLSNDSLNARISGDLYQLPAGMAKFAVGASMTDEKLDLNPSAAYQSGDISGYGGQTLPLSASRNSSAIFAELNAPILKNLEADLAVRTDRYPNATATNPKVSFRYQPLQQLLVRASYGRGFREAALPELNNPQALGTSASFTDPKTNTYGQFNVLSGGNPNLKPEKSEQTSVGIVIDPIPGASIAIDYWKINVNNLVTSLSPEYIIDHEDIPAYGALVQRDAGGNITQITSTNLNAGGLKTAGVDVDARWTIAKTANYGTFGARLNGTYVTKYDMTLPDGTVQQSVARTVDATGSPLNAVANGGIILRWKHQLAFDWKYQSWGVNLTQNFQSGYHDATRADEDLEKSVTPVRVGAFSTWDSQVSYTGVKNLTVRVGVKNLFNRQPPEIIGLGNYFQAGYDPTYYDAHGATGYVSASYKF